MPRSRATTALIDPRTWTLIGGLLVAILFSMGVFAAVGHGCYRWKRIDVPGLVAYSTFVSGIVLLHLVFQDPATAAMLLVFGIGWMEILLFAGARFVYQRVHRQAEQESLRPSEIELN